MLASFVISIRIDRDLPLPGLGGEVLHGIFFETLRAYSPAFAEHLHTLKGEKPFSISGVLTDHPKRDGRIHIAANTRAEFRISLLTDEVIEHALAALGALATHGTPLRLGPASARIEEIAFQPGMHPQVHSSSYPALLQHASEEARVTLQFLSPTSFRAGDVQDILPKPERVFGSLFNAWQAFSPITLDPTLADAFAMLRVSDYELRTELIHFTRYKIIGFKGRVAYTCPRGADATVRRAINALADFSCFAGVGYKTTMGLGQPTRR